MKTYFKAESGTIANIMKRTYNSDFSAVYDIRKNVIGCETTFQGPFGIRKSIYMDKTASGQSMKCIENFIQEHVMPSYGNTHSSSTFTANQSTRYRAEARSIVRKFVGADEDDVVIFCGSGSTAAVHKLVHATAQRNKNTGSIYVFIGPFEHHSNILPWRESGAHIVVVPEKEEGGLDMKFLEANLADIRSKFGEEVRIVGSFSVASNITGITVDDIAVTILMHKYNGLAFWDYAAAAPHVKVQMNPDVHQLGLKQLARKDAIFFSGHKFIPQTPGVLVAKKFVLDTEVPHAVGGGTVVYVTNDSHHYHKDIEEREEGGTPAIIESIRLGLYLHIKSRVGYDYLMNKEQRFIKKILEEWADTPEIEILGLNSEPRIGIVSFMIRHMETGLYLHYNYVVTLLNDLFGIQSRGNCGCAGPYAQTLLGISDTVSKMYQSVLNADNERNVIGEGYELFRPGFVRISLPFYLTTQEENYVIEAIKMVAKWGYKLLPLYECDVTTGTFRHHLFRYSSKTIADTLFDSSGMQYSAKINALKAPSLKKCLNIARKTFMSAEKLYQKNPAIKHIGQPIWLDIELKELKWFLLPSEIVLSTTSEPSLFSLGVFRCPFNLKVYPTTSFTRKRVFYNSIYSQIANSKHFAMLKRIRGIDYTASGNKAGQGDLNGVSDNSKTIGDIIRAMRLAGISLESLNDNHLH